MPSPSVFRTLPPGGPRPGARPAPPLHPAAPPRSAVPPSPSRPAAREERPASPPPLERLRGTTVRLRLVDGSDLRGVLAEVARYELLVRVEGSRLVVVQKGGLVFAEEVDP